MRSHVRTHAQCGPAAVAWTPNFVHVRAMTGQNAMRSDIRHKPIAAAVGEQAPLKLEQFLPYQLNVVATLVSQALSRVYARRYRIGIPEWRVLVTLGQFGVMTGKAIGAHTHMHKTKVSRSVSAPGKAQAHSAAHQPCRHARIFSFSDRGGTRDL
jgi:hypothetical protein